MPPLPMRRIHEETSATESSKLGELGVEWLVVHLNYLSETEKNRLYPKLEKEWGEPILTSKTQWVFQLKWNYRFL